jgi:uncharacterized membrane protein
MNKDIKSLLTSAGIVLFYVFATIGIVRLLWNTDNEYTFEGRVKFLIFSSILFSLFYIIGIYHLIGPYHVDMFYKVLIYGQFLYIIVGLLSFTFIKPKTK